MVARKEGRGQSDAEKGGEDELLLLLLGWPRRRRGLAGGGAACICTGPELKCAHPRQLQDAMQQAQRLTFQMHGSGSG